MKNKSSLILLLALFIGGGSVALAQSTVTKLDRNSWQIIGVSSACDDGGGSGQINCILDDDVNTYWHSNWGGSNAVGQNGGGVPHAFVIDLGSEQEFNGIGYTPRHNAKNGVCKHFKLYVSDEPFTDIEFPFTSENGSKDKVAALEGSALEGEFTYLSTHPERRWAAENTLRGRYVMFVITESYNDNGAWGSCAEFNLYKTEDPRDIVRENLSELIENHVSSEAIGNSVGCYPQTIKDLSQGDGGTVSELNTAVGNFNPQQMLLPEAGHIYRFVSAYPGFENTQGQGHKKAIYRNNATLSWKDVDDADLDQLWTLTPIDGGYAMESVKDKASVGVQPSQSGGYSIVTMTPAVVALELTSLGDRQFNAKTVGSNSSFHCGGHSSGAGVSGNVVTSPGGKDGQSAWYIEDVTTQMTSAVKAYYQEQLNTIDSELLGGKIGGYTGTAESIENAKDVVGNSSSSFAEAHSAYFSNASLSLPQAGRIYRVISAYPEFEKQQGQKKAIYRDGAQLKWQNLNPESLDQLWTLTPTTGGYTMQAVTDNNSVGSIGTNDTPHPLGETGAVIQLTSLGEAQFNLLATGSGNPFHAGSHGNGAGANGSVVKWAGGISSCSAWYIEDVTVEKSEAVHEYYKKRLVELAEKPVGALRNFESFCTTINNASSSDFATFHDNYFNTLKPAILKAFGTGDIVRIITVHGTYVSDKDDKFLAGEVGAHNRNQVWRVVKEGGKFYLKNLGTGRYAPTVVGGDYAGQNMTTADAEEKSTFAFNLNSDASMFNLFTEGVQVNAEPSGVLNYWFADNARFHIDPVGADIVDKLVTIDEAYAKLNTEFPTLNENVEVGNVVWPNEFRFNDLTNNFELIEHAERAATSRDASKMSIAQANLNNFVINSNAYGYPISVIHKVSSEYGTAFMPFNTTCPQGLTLYECNQVETSGTLVLTAATLNGGNFVSNRAYVVSVNTLEGEESESESVLGNTYQFIGYSNQRGAQGNGNSLLVGTHDETTAPVGSYVLQNQNNVLGFYKVESNDIKVPAHKCYLQLPAEAQGVKFLLFPDGTLTSIDAIDAATPDAGAAYDLSGRRVSTTTKGLYIVGGKKVLVK